MKNDEFEINIIEDEYSNFSEKDWNDLLLSNVKNEYKELNLKAIKLSGLENTVYIEDEAIGPNGKILNGYFGLFITKKGNINKFWKIRDELMGLKIKRGES